MLERIGGGGGRESITTIISDVSHPTIGNLLLLLLFIDNNLYWAS